MEEHVNANSNAWNNQEEGVKNNEKKVINFKGYFNYKGNVILTFSFVVF